MKETFFELLNYLKNPILEEDENRHFKYRLLKFTQILVICLLSGFFISPIFEIIEELGWVDMQDHAIEDMFTKFSKPMIFFLAVIIAPFFEELIFRAPLTFFKKPLNFKIAFYGFAFLFGVLHISNFNITKNVLLLTPILVLPQLLLGSFNGFIRVRFGILWCIALHSCYNGILMLLTFAAD